MAGLCSLPSCTDYLLYVHIVCILWQYSYHLKSDRQLSLKRARAPITASEQDKQALPHPRRYVTPVSRYLDYDRDLFFSRDDEGLQVDNQHRFLRKDLKPDDDSVGDDNDDGYGRDSGGDGSDKIQSDSRGKSSMASLPSTCSFKDTELLACSLLLPRKDHSPLAGILS
ncbi:hypothetical protein ANN_04197 [Periplaneta americana]|uniref:Uncharacterized protein n=1 Tax=Periplaneta americana TaxID=6978 RepID=A0ABQ8T9I0_PERAM|nr:hypothetical protein ANN_04197 [Periplaneta americana]